jgi:hypothetical protein
MDSKSIGQGSAFQCAWNNFYQNMVPKLKTDTQSPLIEGNTNMSNTDETNILNEEEEVKEKRQEFQVAYDEYLDQKEKVDNLRSRYLHIINENRTFSEEAQRYFNSIVRYNDRYYYITPFGYRREFWFGTESISNTCGVPGAEHEDHSHFYGFFYGEEPAPPPPTNPNSEYKGRVSASVFNQFLVGEPMFYKTPCGYEGNVVYTNENSYAWVTPSGVRKTFESKGDYEENDNCPNDATLIPTDQFNLMIIGGDMSSDTPCTEFKDNKELNDELTRETNQLKNLTSTLLDKYEALIRIERTFRQDMQTERNNFQHLISEIQDEIELDERLSIEEKTSREQWQDQVVNERMQYYQYGGLLAITLIIGGITIYHLRSK